MHPTPEAIIFDCDGTLMLSGNLHYSAISAAAANHGATMPWDWYSRLTGLDRTQLYRTFASEFGLHLDIPQLVRESIELTIGQAHQARPNPPVADYAKAMYGHCPLAVATNSERIIVDALLSAHNLFGLFATVVGVDEVSNPKPTPDLFLTAAARMGVSPDACLVIEDSDQGLAAAHAAGMTAIDTRNESELAKLTVAWRIN